MKKFLILLATICCCGCSGDGDVETVNYSEPHPTSVGYFTYVQYDGHEYLIWINGSYQNGITHSPNCPCKNK